MQIGLIYDAAGAARNAFLIERYRAHAARRGVPLSLVMDDLALQTPMDTAIVRTVNPALSRALEARGARVYNPALVSAVCNDKLETFRRLAPRGVRMLPCAPPARECPFPFPAVVKPRCLSGGRGVRLVYTAAQYRAACEALAGTPALVQPAADTLGRDVRVYVLGGAPVMAMERISAGDFRSNFCLGGTARPHALTAAEAALVARVAAALPLGLAGVDLLEHAGAPLVNEVEDVVGARMLYAITDIDIAARYLDFILARA